MCKIKFKFPNKEHKILQISESEEIELSDEQFESRMNKVCKNFEDYKSKEIFLIRKGLHNDKILRRYLRHRGFSSALPSHEDPHLPFS